MSTFIPFVATSPMSIPSKTFVRSECKASGVILMILSTLINTFEFHFGSSINLLIIKNFK